MPAGRSNCVLSPLSKTNTDDTDDTDTAQITAIHGWTRMNADTRGHRQMRAGATRPAEGRTAIQKHEGQKRAAAPDICGSFLAFVLLNGSGFAAGRARQSVGLPVSRSAQSAQSADCSY